MDSKENEIDLENINLEENKEEFKDLEILMI